MRKLAGKAKDLGHHSFSYYEKGLVLDLMKDRCEEILNDGSLVMKKIYMTGMFSSVTVKVDPFVKYLEFMFTDNKVNLLLYAS